MTTANATIAIPQDLLTEKTDLEAAGAKIIAEQDRLTAQRKDIEAALLNINTVLDILSGKTPVPVATNTVRKPMSPQARRRISEALKAAAARKKQAAAGTAPAAPHAAAEQIAATALRADAADLKKAATVAGEPAATKLTAEAARLENWAGKIDGKSAAAADDTPVASAPAQKSAPAAKPATKTAAKK